MAASPGARAPDALWQRLLRGGPVLLTGPVQPDGDSIGAALALQRMLKARGVPATVAGTAPGRYAWMPGAREMRPDAEITPDYPTVVVLDGDRHRLPAPVRRAFEAATTKGIIDHHASTRDEGYTVAWIEPEAESTCTMLYNALGRWGFSLDPELATLLYVGLIFDTGGFRYSNTRPSTHHMAAELLSTGIPHAAINARILAERSAPALRLAGQVYTEATLHLDGRLALGRVPRALQDSLGLRPGDLEGVVDALVHIGGVEVASLLIERPDGSTKHSLRSRGRIDVAALAQRLSPTGGGHAKAAGAHVPHGLQRAAQVLIEAVRAALGAAP